MRGVLLNSRSSRTIFFFPFFFFNDTATTEIYTLSLHDALPISPVRSRRAPGPRWRAAAPRRRRRLLRLPDWRSGRPRSEEHTSELQSRPHLVCRLLLEKKNHSRTTRRPRRRRRFYSPRKVPRPA